MWSSSQTAAEDLEATTLSVLLLFITQEFICAEEREENQPFTHSTATMDQCVWISLFVIFCVLDGDVILESPVHPVTEGHPLTLHCLYRNTNSSNLRADFYKDGSVLQTQTTGEMIIQTVSKSDEGFYHCKHPERGESLKSWLSVKGPSCVEAPFSVLMLISSVVTASPYLLVTIILLVKCYRARAHTDEERIENAVIGVSKVHLTKRRSV
ncbi:uncharacterized protein LOC128318145 [Pangasianodon hypophthalmus]|uniref:uncharacterized protein LOC128318145 n=1 Tax=Pangasianodon hypophthalmus TaxID=310915 RepID=UPI002306EF78|nr:uncharacterized protein LOC128318145 [Pangasianodon hypophthalmus]